MSGKQSLLSGGLVFACIILALLLAAFIAVSAVILESHTYKKAARDEAYLTGVEKDAVSIMKEAAAEHGLSKTMLLQHVQSKEIRKLAQRNAADAALVLKGSQVIYGNSFDQAALQLDIYKFYAQRLPDPEAATAPENDSSDPGAQQGNAEAPTPDAEQATAPADETVTSIQAQDTAPLLWNAEEDPEREALRQQADETAAEIAARIDTAVRVIDMEQVVYDHSDGYLLDWLRFMGRGGVLLPLILLGLLLLLLYRLTWERGFSRWLAGISFCAGILLLACAAVIPAMGLLNLSVEPVQLAILYASVTRGLLAELLVMSVLWFIIGYIAMRAAIGRPISTRWLKALFARLRPATDAADTDSAPDAAGAPATASPETPDAACPETPKASDTSDAARSETPDVPTVSDTSPIGNISSTLDSTPGNRSASSLPTNAALLETIKKAAADSTNSLLGRKRR